ncbi:MAG: thrombospondin type 3 repeat-containing protein, partial [Candidatus Binatia bacterium]
RHRLRTGAAAAAGMDGQPVSAAAFATGDGGDSNTGVTRSVDSQPYAHDTAFDFANHASHTDPMTNDRLDRVLRKASKRMGKTSFTADVACCVEFHRAGAGGWFGKPGDGLDVIDNEAELAAVLDQPVGRVKVVRAINYCGGPGTNIIGCSWMGRNGAAIVRLPKGKQEAALWLHEYGHNIGLDHNPASSDYIMYPSIYSNRAVTQAECNQYHSPPAASESLIVSIGACADSEADGIVDNIDNCPTIANLDQLDLDKDGVGDVCELL